MNNEKNNEHELDLKEVNYNHLDKYNKKYHRVLSNSYHVSGFVISIVNFKMLHVIS